MRQAVTVVEREGKLFEQVVRTEACQSCRACQFGEKKEVLVPLQDGDFRAGDQIELEIPEGSTGLASLLSYGIPLVMLLIGLFVGGWIANLLQWKQDLVQAGCALLFAAAGVLLLRRLEPKFRRSGRFSPRTCGERRES